MHSILIADPEQRKALKPVLRKAGLTVEAVESLELADFKLETCRFDLILLDQEPEEVLPLLVAWRSRGIMADIVVLLPLHTSPAHRTSCLNAGADVCMTHPVVMEELSAHLRALGRRNRTIPEPALRIYDLVINSDARSVHRAGRSIGLTAREFDVLHLLASNRGKVLTQSIIREQLFESVDPDSSNIVSVYIRRLREKIDEPFGLPLILTCWGQGYQLRTEETPGK